MTMRTSDSRPMMRFPADSINCFTGGLALLLARHGIAARESRLLEQGDGYLFRAGMDEYGDPEYRFDVEAVGLRGCARLGADMGAFDLDGERWLSVLRSLTNDRRGAMVWVNTRWLTYEAFYSGKPAYLHAVLVTDVAADGQWVRIHDPLVVNRERYGCEVWMRAGSLHAALADEGAVDRHGQMGRAHAVTAVRPGLGVPHPLETARALERQAICRRLVPAHRDAVAEYGKACMGRLTAQDVRVGAAARRLFDHINVLYVLPGLELVRQSLLLAQVSAGTLENLDMLVGHWRALGLLALKFEATESPKVLARIEERFAVISAAEQAMWLRIETDATRPDRGTDMNRQEDIAS